MDTNKLKISELDFDTIKANLVDFLKSDTNFSDYNFEGSGLSILLDAMAYNTHYMGFYLNMVANEMFLDSAVKRDSVVSIAKHLGYTPASATAANISVDLALTTSPISPGDSPNFITIPKGTKFTTSKDSVSYEFVTLDQYVSSAAITANQTSFTIAGVKIYEGTLTSTEIVADPNNLGQRFVLPTNVDTSTLIVKVKATSTAATQTTYTKFDDISKLTSTSTTYFLNEVESGQYEVSFGDGVLGKKLEAGNVVSLEYLICSGTIDANEIGRMETSTSRVFALGSTITGVTTAVVKSLKDGSTVSEYTTGGTVPEGIDSIKFFAPKSFQTQKRAVTVDDYKTFITNNYTNASSVLVWGGEDNDPPQYGKVFIAVKPTTGLTLTPANKTTIKDDILANSKVLCIQPEIVDPEYTYIKVSTVISYDNTKIVDPIGKIETDVSDKIVEHGTINLGTFSGSFRFSKLVSEIDKVSTAIKSSFTSLGVRKRVTPNTDSTIVDSWILQYNTPITKGTIISDSFILNDSSEVVSFVDKDGILQLQNTGGLAVNTNAGSVDYDTGKITISSINISSISSGFKYISINSDVDQIDLKPKTGQILLIEKGDVSVSSKIDTN